MLMLRWKMLLIVWVGRGLKGSNNVFWGGWQRSKNLLEPLLEDSNVPVEVGQTWRGSRRWNPVLYLKRGLETAVTTKIDFNNDKRFKVPKDVSPVGEVSKARVATSNLNSQSECQCTVLLYSTMFSSNPNLWRRRYQDLQDVGCYHFLFLWYV